MQSLRNLLGNLSVPLLLVLALVAFTPPPALAQSAPLVLVQTIVDSSGVTGPVDAIALEAAVPTVAFLAEFEAHALRAGLGVTQSESVMPEPTEAILQYFKHDHLPPHLAQVSKPFSDLAHSIVLGDPSPENGGVTIISGLPRNPERTVALRKLLEAKDAAVRAALTPTT
jgi:hypothetical protein